MYRCANASWRAAFTVALALGISHSVAVAQTYKAATEPGPDQAGSSPEIVTVTPARPGVTRSTIGAPIQDVSLSATVQTDDLSPYSIADWEVLGDRVRETARRLCDRLAFQYPIGTPDRYQCMRRAVRDTTDEIDANLRNYGSAPRMENP